MAESYDIIIVGGGSAGCVLAARLSEAADLKVCLLEAGGRDWHPFYKMPAGFAKMTKGIGAWGWQTVPQRHMQNRVLNYTQARVIGGGSTVNAQIYTRGNALDYDEWRQIGCDGWSYDDVLPYFRKAEDNDTYNNAYHGQGGPLGVSQPRAPLPICDAYFEAAAELGIPRNHDMTGETQDGVGFYQLTQKHARRSSTSVAYLKPALNRSNLTVKTGVQVRWLIVENHRAVGVELMDGARVMAEQEVILSSGAIGSPRLLMLSGLGPADHLREVGVDVILDQPEIGANLQDHLDLFTISECTGDHTYDKYAKPHWSAVAGLQYLLTKRGPVASSLFETGGFWYAEEGARSPDIQFHLGLGSGIEAGVAKMANPGVTLNSAYLRPRSRGTVRLASADPAAAPLIDPNYWADPHDREMSIRGLKLAQEILRQDALKPFVKREVLPGPDVQSDAEFHNFACANAKTDHHPAGTCRMGPDAAAVVDTRLKFNGISGLRVVDASIMPRLISSNTNAPTIMIAEKAADMIRADHGV
ncbi:alanine-phosphoribitol ligase [Roseobacter sp. HKCCD9010]|uniref:GMC family oxidoreductase n=1 Tax=unclassified Roseobacter TaxID=196798 RepID=UPI001490BBC3|nr:MULTISPECIES: GMC family oxidoreductase N-terminal domain-containing protein [unclassified Roseobacter]MBF9049719.1 alanine-phosphoribitol ligase [Rhodobacterales bacterium HKCCD4356]NNV11719.1 alanine-phosphoribitol ligase [Roseobacter sp. HKCCD7357]NNV15903.1 alanine-phosphoribitol ligase [Roseobacter sp. HKCCD8768]NNV25363.1 alanine-phosphoribitol ligase [Roseobacter sp. HKCCD8192]NNV29620.1 alanine-phosphoribitol ligase [Roseobacter sp. HKCCD9061]